MTRAARTALIVAGAFVGILLAAGVLSQIPAVQTAAVRSLAERLPSEVRVGRVAIKGFRSIVLTDLLVLDQEPFVPTEEQWRGAGMAQAPAVSDTVLYIGRAEASFTLKSLLSKSETPSIASLRACGAVVHYVAEPDGSNFSRVFALSGKDLSGPFEGHFVIRSAEASDVRATMTNYHPRRTTYRGIGINWFDTDITLDLLKSKNIDIARQVRADISEARIREKTGCSASVGCELRIEQGRITFEDVDYKDDYCHTLASMFAMTWNETSDWKHFSDSIGLELHLRPCTFSLHSLSQYIDLLPGTRALFDIHSDCSAIGVWDDFDVRNLCATELGTGTKTIVNGRIIGMDLDSRNAFDLHDTRIEGTAQQILSLTKDILSPSLDSLDAGKIFLGSPLEDLPLTIGINGARGHLDSLHTDISISGRNLGTLEASVLCRHLTDAEAPSFSGFIDADGIDAGALLKSEKIGKAGIRINAEATLGDSPRATLKSLVVKRFDALGYKYGGITAQGDYSRGRFSLTAACKDPNLTFDLTAKYSHSEQTGNTVYNFTMPLKADLNALGIDKRAGGSELDCVVKLNARDLTGGRYIAGAEINGVTFTDKDGAHDIGDIRLLSDYSSTSNHVTFKAPFASGGYVGEVDITKAPSDIESLTVRKSIPALFKDPGKEWSGKGFELKLSFGDTKEILNLIAPGIYIAGGTELRASVNNQGEFGASFNSRRIALKQGNAFNIAVEANAGAGSATTLSARMSNFTVGEDIALDSLFLDVSARDNIIGATLCDSLVDLTVKAFRKSGDLGFSAKLGNADLSMGDRIAGKDIGLGGRLRGTAAVLFKKDQTPRIGCSFITDSLSIHGISAGRIALKASSQGEDIVAKLNMKSPDGSTCVKFEGSYNPSSDLIESEARLNSFNPSIAGNLFPSLFSELDGKLSGALSATGSTKHIDLQGKGLRIEDTRIGLAPTGVVYTANGEFSLDGTDIEVRHLSLRDDAGGEATVEGNLKEAVLNLSNVRVLDKEYDGNGFYGKLAIDGEIRYCGAETNSITGSIATSGEGSIHIGLQDVSGSEAQNSILQFRKADKDEDAFTYRKSDTPFEATNLDIDCSVSIGQDVSAWFEIDKAEGNILNGSGAGTVSVKYTGSEGKLSLGGSYVLSGGKYHFSALGGLVTKDFSIEPGSSLNFGGGIMDTEFDVGATHTLKASLSQLISDTTSTVSSRRTVNCSLRITDKLSSPKMKFSIDVPDLDPATKSIVDGELNTEDKVQKQFVALLVSGSFLSSEQAGVINNTSLIYENLSAIMAAQFNNILKKIGVPIDFGMNYTQNEVGTDIFDVAISTTLFDDKVTVNGSLGNRKYSSGADDGMVGDIDISVKLNRDGSLLMNLFSHSADDYTNYLDNSQRSGIGVAYQKNYNRLFDLFRRKKERIAVEEEKMRTFSL